MSLRLFTAIVNQKLAVLMIPVSSPLCTTEVVFAYCSQTHTNFDLKCDSNIKKKNRPDTSEYILHFCWKKLGLPT